MKHAIRKTRSVAVVVATIACMLLPPLAARAEETSPANTYSGDLLIRSTLTGDWGGVRNNLAAKGVTIDMSVTQTEMGVSSGGKKTGSEYGGRGNVTVNIDTQKLGLYPGGFFTVEVEGNFGNENVNSSTGALMPVNTNQTYPMPGRNLDVPAVTVTQFFSEYFGIFFGKLDSSSGNANEFAHGKGDNQFFNMSFNTNPVGLLTPYSALGAGVIILPTKDPEAINISVSAVDGDGQPNTSGFHTVFSGNTIYGIEGRVRTDFFGLTGHQLMGAMYLTKNFESIDQSFRFVIENSAIQQKDNSWCFYYNFDQYLYEPKKGSGKGIGIFGRFGVTDGNPNPIFHFYSIGIGGKGVIPGRANDSFGLGYYYIDVSNPSFTGPLATREFLRDEYGVEAYYNYAITPWMKLTPDIQVVRPAQKESVSVVAGAPPIITRKNIDTATVLGMRLQLIF